MEQQYQWKELLDKYIRNTLTPEEETALYEQIAASPGKQRTWERLTDAALFEEDMYAFGDPETDKAWHQFTQTHPAYIARPQVAWLRKLTLPMASAAAAVAFTVCLNWWELPSSGMNGSSPFLIIPGRVSFNLHKTADGKIAHVGGMGVYQMSHSLLVRYLPTERVGWENLRSTLSVPEGELYNITLGDGSVIWIDSMSTLTFPAMFTGPKREVEVTGHCYFEVTKNADQPFAVHMSRDAWVEVKGTRFSVRAYNQEVHSVSLLEGEVVVRRGQEEMTLKPGERAVLAKGGIQRVQDIIEEQEKWVRDIKHFDFRKMNIQEVLTLLGVWYNKQIVIQGNLSTQMAGAVFPRTASLNTILQSLKTMHAFDYEEKGDSLIVTAR